jgi:chromate reductase
MRNVAVLVGNLRKESISRRIAGFLSEVSPSSLHLKIVETGDLPLCKQDDDARSPASSVACRASVKEADAALFVPPEYNRSIPRR